MEEMIDLLIVLKKLANSKLNPDEKLAGFVVGTSMLGMHFFFTIFPEEAIKLASEVARIAEEIEGTELNLSKGLEVIRRLQDDNSNE